MEKKERELTDILIDAIRKGLLFGCSGRQVSKLFNISHRVIKKAKTIQYKIIKDYEDSLYIETMKENGISYKKNKVTIKEDSIEIVLIEKINLN